MTTFLKKIPGFRSGKRWRSLIASIFYFSGFLIVMAIGIAIVSPSPPTLALDKINPTNKTSISVSGKTYAGKPAYLLKDNQVVQSIRADSNGKFYFVLNDLKDGNYSHTVEVCNSEKRDKCRTENILITVDQTPPTKPIIALPERLPDDSDEQIVIKGVSEPNAKIVASVQNNELQPTATNDKGEFEIKTGLVLGANTINVKAVDTLGNESELSGASLDFNPTKYKVKVIRVIDGDTIKIEGDKVVRYIGIDTPETVHPSKPVQCYGKEASNKNKELVEGKEVKLEKDVSETDKYGRLLRYIWLGDMLVNEYLAREGYAYSSTYPPDVKYQDRFLEVQKQAREEKKGLWGEVCNPSPTPTTVQKTTKTYEPPITFPTNQSPPTQSSPQPSQQQQTTTSQTTTSQSPAQTGGSYTCDCSKTCPQMSSCAEAQYQLNVCGCKARDADKDGIACDSDCQ